MSQQQTVEGPFIDVGGSALPEFPYGAIDTPGSRAELRRRYKPILGFGAAQFVDLAKNSDYPSGYVGPSSKFYENKGYVGYLQGTQPPIALDYVKAWFMPEGALARSARPLTEETYQEFLQFMFQSFQKGLIPGQVSFDPPSMADVKTILASDPQLRILMTKIPHGTERHVVLSEPEIYGLPTSRFRPQGYGLEKAASVPFVTPMKGTAYVQPSPTKKVPS